MFFPGLPAAGSSSESDSRASWSSLSSVREVRGRGHSGDQCPAWPQLKHASPALVWLVLGICLGGTDDLGEEEDVEKGEAEIRSWGLPRGRGAELVAWN